MSRWIRPNTPRVYSFWNVESQVYSPMIKVAIFREWRNDVTNHFHQVKWTYPTPHPIGTYPFLVLLDNKSTFHLYSYISSLSKYAKGLCRSCFEFAHLHGRVALCQEGWKIHFGMYEG